MKEHPMFTATMYGNAKEAFMAKAEYYEKALARANDMLEESKNSIFQYGRENTKQQVRIEELEKIIDEFVDEN